MDPSSDTRRRGGAAAWVSSSAGLCLESWWALRETGGEWRYFSADLPGDKSGSLTNRPQLGLTILFFFHSRLLSML